MVEWGYALRVVETQIFKLKTEISHACIINTCWINFSDSNSAFPTFSYSPIQTHFHHEWLLHKIIENCELHVMANETCCNNSSTETRLWRGLFRCLTRELFSLHKIKFMNTHTNRTICLTMSEIENWKFSRGIGKTIFTLNMQLTKVLYWF